MAAYRRVYDSRHLQADCQEPGSAPEPYCSVIEYGLLSVRGQCIVCVTVQSVLDPGNYTMRPCVTRPVCSCCLSCACVVSSLPSLTFNLKAVRCISTLRPHRAHAVRRCCLLRHVSHRSEVCVWWARRCTVQKWMNRS